MSGREDEARRNVIGSPIESTASSLRRSDVTDSYLTEMPWARIVKVTAGFGLGLTALYVAALRQAHHEKEESERVYWTDKNRWE